MKRTATPVADVELEWPAGNNGKRVLDVVTRGVHGPLSPLLMPVEQLYSGVIAIRNRAYDRGIFTAQRVPVPVISVGNIVAGGAGKTPVVRWLVDQLLKRERRPAILHGGYGSDEPKLHQIWHPEVFVISERDRVAAARQAIERGADVIVLDDAFQHRRLARDLDIVLMASESANQHLLPRGPGREHMAALQRAGYVLVTRKTAATDRAFVMETEVHKAAPRAKTGRAHLRLHAELPARPIVVVSSIARPDLFVGQLQELGAEITTALAYPDHYDYTAADAAYIAERASDHLIVTTAKDAVKLRELMRERPLHVVEQELIFESGQGELMTAVDNVL
jgi:tetraacyldisaccharide 4'-kinase